MAGTTPTGAGFEPVMTATADASDPEVPPRLAEQNNTLVPPALLANPLKGR